MLQKDENISRYDVVRNYIREEEWLININIKLLIVGNILQSFVIHFNFILFIYLFNN